MTVTSTVSAGQSGANTTTDSHATPFRANQQVSFGNLKVCIDQADQLTSPEGWRESFRRLMHTGIVACFNMNSTVMIDE